LNSLQKKQNTKTNKLEKPQTNTARFWQGTYQWMQRSEGSRCERMQGIMLSSSLHSNISDGNISFFFS